MIFHSYVSLPEGYRVASGKIDQFLTNKKDETLFIWMIGIDGNPRRAIEMETGNKKFSHVQEENHIQTDLWETA